ncbi:hypothetical protein BAUCODRAFT_335736, partial [Baudoinia panamericana UAMH 10762]
MALAIIFALVKRLASQTRRSTSCVVRPNSTGWYLLRSALRCYTHHSVIVGLIKGCNASGWLNFLQRVEWFQDMLIFNRCGAVYRGRVAEVSHARLLHYEAAPFAYESAARLPVLPCPYHR